MSQKKKKKKAEPRPVFRRPIGENFNEKKSLTQSKTVSHISGAKYYFEIQGTERAKIFETFGHHKRSNLYLSKLPDKL